MALRSTGGEEDPSSESRLFVVSPTQLSQGFPPGDLGSSPLNPGSCTLPRSVCAWLCSTSWSPSDLFFRRFLPMLSVCGNFHSRPPLSRSSGPPLGLSLTAQGRGSRARVSSQAKRPPEELISGTPASLSCIFRLIFITSESKVSKEAFFFFIKKIFKTSRLKNVFGKLPSHHGKAREKNPVGFLLREQQTAFLRKTPRAPHSHRDGGAGVRGPDAGTLGHFLTGREGQHEERALL